jgi:hypothetical protein
MIESGFYYIYKKLMLLFDLWTKINIKGNITILYDLYNLKGQCH